MFRVLLLALSLVFTNVAVSYAQYSSSSEINSFKKSYKKQAKNNRIKEDDAKEIQKNEACWNEYFAYLEENSIMPDDIFQGGKDYCKGRTPKGTVVGYGDVDAACWQDFILAMQDKSLLPDDVYDNVKMDCGENDACWENYMKSNALMCGDVYSNAQQYCSGNTDVLKSSIKYNGSCTSTGGGSGGGGGGGIGGGDERYYMKLH